MGFKLDLASLGIPVDDTGSPPQKTFTYIVAASGGDYTTLSAAMAAASSGDSIFIENGTYTEAGFTTTLDDITIIGENPGAVILQFGGNAVDFASDNVYIANISTEFVTTGGYTAWLMLGASIRLIDFTFTDTGTGSQSTTYSNFWIKVGSSDAKLIRCVLTLSGSVTSYAKQLNIDGTLTQCIDSTFKANTSATGDTENNCVMRILGSLSGCYISTISGTNTGNLAGIITSSRAITNCKFNYFGSGAILLLGGGSVLTGCDFFRTSGIAIRAIGWESMITSNNIEVLTTGIGIQLEYYSCIVSNNQMSRSSGTDGQAIKIPSEVSIDNNMITSNLFTNFAIGVYILGTPSNTVVSANSFQNVTTAIFDNGTDTYISGNAGT